MWIKIYLKVLNVFRKWIFFNFWQISDTLAAMSVVSARMQWFPIQRGVQLTTQAILGLHQDLVMTGQYKYLLTGRLNTDTIENLFSQIRSAVVKTPDPVQFKQALRLVTISQYLYVRIK